MPVIHFEESRRRASGTASTHVEPIKAEKQPESGPCDQSDQSDQSQQSEAPRFTAEQRWVIEARREIDDYMVMLRRLRSLPPEEVFLELSGITTRLAELRLACVRSEARRLVALRTKEIDPLIEECDRQFRFHSRIQAIRQMEWDQTRNLT